MRSSKFCLHFNSAWTLVSKQLFLYSDCAYNRAYRRILVIVEPLIWAEIEFVYNLYWAESDMKVAESPIFIMAIDTNVNWKFICGKINPEQYIRENVLCHFHLFLSK